MGVARTILAVVRFLHRHPRKAIRLLILGDAGNSNLGGGAVSGGHRRLRWLLLLAEGQRSRDPSDYEGWIAANDQLTSDDFDKMRAIISGWSERPLISILMPVCETPEPFLVAAIESVLHQTYENWELCLADDASVTPRVRKVLEGFAGQDSRIRVVFRATRGGIAVASNTALGLATGNWIAFLDHDDMLAPHALFCVVDAVRRNPHSQFLYSDEDKLGVDGRRCDPYFKPPLNLELLRSHNYLTHFAVFRRALIQQLGGLREGFDGSQDYDLILRAIDSIPSDSVVHIPHVLYHWRVHPQSTASGVAAKPRAIEAGARALAEHLRRRGLDGDVEATAFGYRMRYKAAKNPGLVSIIIPTRNRHEVLRTCIESLLASSREVPFEIIVMDNGSDEEAAVEYLRSFANHPLVRVVRDDQPFNYSRLNNRAVALARGQYLVLLNNDTEVISSDWLVTMTAIMSQPDVGAVGVKLLYPDGTIQHGGVIVGLGGVAGHAHLRRLRTEGGYFGRAQLQQEFGAVTGACMLLRKADYVAVQGLDEQRLAVAFNDVDLCLKLRRLGKRIVWTPFVEFYHHESLSRGLEDTSEKRARFESEVRHMFSTWQDALAAGDPGYNANLSLSTKDFHLAARSRAPKPWQ